ncbi:hypothetical protein VNO80_18095 [Phaseolus coccineus]|uniref:Uncharacterized protein n=1 Tax=Phaseolus coccineus TaxID=3886 RepID=A0AAN9R3K0_PHACN
MEVAVLHPHDSLANIPPNHYQTLVPRFPNMKLSSPNPKLPKLHRSSRNRKKRADPAPKVGPDPTQHTKSVTHQPQHPIMGQVKILKRGQVLAQKTPDLQLRTETVEASPTLPSAETVEASPTLPSAETVEITPTLPSTGKVDGLYAGYSLLVMSPPPNSVPLPAFITKKIAAANCATSEL